MRRFTPALVLFALTLAACGGDDGGPADPAVDTTAPAAVTDLAVTASTETTLTLGWTAPGDDGATGTAAAYDLRVSSATITEATWAAATPVDGEPAPAAAGATQSMTVDDPSKSDLYAALKTVDDAGNWSALSNVADGDFDDPGGVRRITTDTDDRQPCLWDGIVTFVIRDGAGYEIGMANLDDPYPSASPITDSGFEKAHPSSHGTARIVWQQREDGLDDWEIWVYSPISIPRYWAHTDNEVDDVSPVLAGAGDYAWLQGGFPYEAVAYWDESGHSDYLISDDCCSTDEYSNESLAAHDGDVVWRVWDRAGSGPFRTILYTFTATDISDDVDANQSRNYSLYDGTLAYEHGVPAQIGYWDGSTALIVGAGEDPSLYDGRIAFSRYVGGDWEIFYWDGSEVRRITDNDIDDTEPTLHGHWLAWTGRPSGGAGQIYFTAVD